MKKSKFLRELDKKLMILSDDERNDIINEYEDIIDDKVNNGKTEEEAVKEFGKLDELAKEILSTYKINSNYGKEKEKKDIKFEEHIENGAKKLSEWTNNFIDSFRNKDMELSLEDAFKVTIKIILLLLALIILRLPFYILGELGNSFISLGYMPFNGVLSTIWQIILSLFYAGVCVFIIFVSASKLFDPKSKGVKKKEKNSNIKNNSKKTGNLKEEKKEIKKEETETSSFMKVIIFILKLMVFISFVFPLYCTLFCLIFALACVLFMIIKGIFIWGILISVIASIIFVYILIKVIGNLLNGKKKSYIPALAVSMVMLFVGVLLSINYLTSINFEYEVDTEELSKSEYTFSVDIDEYYSGDSLNIYISDYEKEKEVVVDDSLEDNKVKIVIEYYDKYLNEEDFEYTYYEPYYDYYYESDNTGQLAIRYNNDNQAYYRLSKDMLEELKNGNFIYNFEDLVNYKVTIYVNSETYKKI